MVSPRQRRVAPPCSSPQARTKLPRRFTRGTARASLSMARVPRPRSCGVERPTEQCASCHDALRYTAGLILGLSTRCTRAHTRAQTHHAHLIQVIQPWCSTISQSQRIHCMSCTPNTTTHARTRLVQVCFQWNSVWALGGAGVGWRPHGEVGHLLQLNAQFV